MRNWCVRLVCEIGVQDLYAGFVCRIYVRDLWVGRKAVKKAWRKTLLGHASVHSAVKSGCGTLPQARRRLHRASPRDTSEEGRTLGPRRRHQETYV